MKFTSIQDQLPASSTVVWVKRKSGAIYLGYRNEMPLTINQDASRDCFWYGNAVSDRMTIDGFCTLKFHNNFSDITVDGWAYIESPKVSE